MKKLASPIAYVVLMSALIVLCSKDASAQCAAPFKVEWPSAAPVWSLCWTPPNQSSGIDGSGLELRHVFYKGKRVFWRANMPVLDVLYDQPSGFCGPTYRDWLNELQAFDANNVVSPGYAEPTITPKTVCDAPGADVGSFAGVAVERLADRLVLTTQTRAGWYRYIQKITFYADGRIQPYFGFTAVEYPCIHRAHMHHGYWRFDFDIDGAGGDIVDERRKFLWLFPYWSTLSSEQARFRTASGFRHWRVRDAQTGRGVEVIPGPSDAVGGDAFGGSDVWALRYHSNETDDGGATGGPSGDAQHIDAFLNNENINQKDVVLWYRVGHRHESGPTCQLAGPTLKLTGNW